MGELLRKANFFPPFQLPQEEFYSCFKKTSHSYPIDWIHENWEREFRTDQVTSNSPKKISKWSQIRSSCIVCRDCLVVARIQLRTPSKSTPLSLFVFFCFYVGNYISFLRWNTRAAKREAAAKIHSERGDRLRGRLTDEHLPENWTEGGGDRGSEIRSESMDDAVLGRWMDERIWDDWIWTNDHVRWVATK